MELLVLINGALLMAPWIKTQQYACLSYLFLTCCDLLGRVASLPQDGEAFGISTQRGCPYLTKEFQFRTAANKVSRSDLRNSYNRLHFVPAYQEGFCCRDSAHFGICFRLTYKIPIRHLFLGYVPRTYLQGCIISITLTFLLIMSPVVSSELL